MCYSARIQADYRQYVKAYGAHLSIRDFYEIFWRRTRDARVKIPKAMEAPFLEQTTTDDDVAIKALIEQFNDAVEAKLQRELFMQRKRLGNAERVLQTRMTKKAQEDVRIATTKIDWALGKLSDLRRVEPAGEDSRIYPQHYAPVLVVEDGRRVIKPMRYQCRLPGKPATYDAKFAGTYNARRDNLEGYWKDLFGYSHGLVLVDSFFENVNRHRAEGRELAADEAVENVVLEFSPEPREQMLVACLWSRWVQPGDQDLLSFAAITDEPPPEVASAGHDRCIIPIRPEHIDAWLQPSPSGLAKLYQILDDRARPYYEHRWLEAA